MRCREHLPGAFVNSRGERYSVSDWKEWSGLLVARMVQCVHGFAC